MTYSDTKTAFDKALAAYKRAAQREVAAILAEENVVYCLSTDRSTIFWYKDGKRSGYPSKVQKIFDAFSIRTGRFLFSDKELENLRVKMERDSFWKAGICPITGNRLKKKGSD
jgi:hypothetical protein